MANAKPRKPAPRAAAKRATAASVKSAAAKTAAPIKAARPVVPTKAAPKPAPKPAPAPAPVVEATKAVVEAAPPPVPAPAPAPITEAVEAVVAAAEPTIEAITKGPDMATTETLKKNAEFSSDRVQAIFGDVNGRTQTAIDKSTKLFEEVTDFAKGNVEAIVASSRVAAKGAETLGQEAAEYGKKSFEQASATLRSFATVKSPTELFQLQSDYAKTSFDALVAESSKLSESFLKLAGDIAQPLSSRFALAAEKVKSASTF